MPQKISILRLSNLFVCGIAMVKIIPAVIPPVAIAIPRFLIVSSRDHPNWSITRAEDIL